MNKLEKEITEIIKDVYKNDLNVQPWEDVADGLDFWRDKEGSLIMEGRGMQPPAGVECVASVDDGVIWVK